MQSLISGLIYYPDEKPGITRQKRGRGFSYLASDGTRVACKKMRARLNALAVPPAYQNVWMSPHDNGHLQATGRDDRNRKQYQYHPDWSAQRAQRKFDQLANFGETLPSLRRWIDDRLSGEVGEVETAVAAVLALIDRASLRVGHPDYTADNGSYGATTLRNRHVDFDGSKIILNYTAKGGKAVSKQLQGKKLQRVLEQSEDLPGPELVSWINSEGDVKAVRSEQVQTVLKGICGENISAKTLRTWNGSHAAFQMALTSAPVTIKDMATAAAERLHNTPTIARNSYIHPDIIALSDLNKDQHARWLKALKPSSISGLRQGEAELLTFLS
ncbi:DNA topoisomerase IB [Sulfitobacter sp. 1151]|uniref:DNA topoisomerase n=2 Tax=Parasulfitobacter algicola TaxID=2614809 RepID=A0ABX2IUF4_9RHOB|nr:DNA topoisomerase IB [Sulfitobacter algicola]